MNDIKVLVLCNSPIALPAIKELIFQGRVAAIAVPQRNKELPDQLGALIKDGEIPVLRMHKPDYQVQLAEAITKYSISLGVLMTFPYKLAPELLQLPKLGFLNFHYGLLPQYRGPQPILQHMINMETEAGVTIHRVDEGIDTGPVVLQSRIPIRDTDTYGALESRLALLAAKMAINLVKILTYGSFIPALGQDETKAAYYEKAGAKELTIDWQKMTGKKIIRLVNACNPWNKGAGNRMPGWGFLVTEAEICGDVEDAGMEPGSILACNKEDGLIVASIDKKKLKLNIIHTTEGFYSGYRLAEFGIRVGDIFGL